MVRRWLSETLKFGFKQVDKAQITTVLEAVTKLAFPALQYESSFVSEGVTKGQRSKYQRRYLFKVRISSLSTYYTIFLCFTI